MTQDEKEKLKNLLWNLVITIENSSHLPDDWIRERTHDINELFDESGQNCA